MAFQGIDNAQSIGYIIPTPVAKMFLAAAAAPEGYMGVQEVGERDRERDRDKISSARGLHGRARGWGWG